MTETDGSTFVANDDDEDPGESDAGEIVVLGDSSGATTRSAFALALAFAFSSTGVVRGPLLARDPLLVRGPLLARGALLARGFFTATVLVFGFCPRRSASCTNLHLSPWRHHPTARQNEQCPRPRADAGRSRNATAPGFGLGAGGGFLEPRTQGVSSFSGLGLGLGLGLFLGSGLGFGSGLGLGATGVRLSVRLVVGSCGGWRALRAWSFSRRMVSGDDPASEPVRRLASTSLPP